jgi:hypothetical protein
VVSHHSLQLPQWWSSTGVSELLTPVGGVVPVIGAGVSRSGGLPDGRQLAEWLVRNAPMSARPWDDSALFSVVDAVDPARMTEGELRELVARHVNSFAPQPTPFVDQLVHLPSRFIVTFNYDDLLGLAAERQGLKVCRLSALDSGDRREAHRRLTAKEAGLSPDLTVFHIHGRARTPETMVLTSASYNELDRLLELDEIVFTLAHFRSLAFVGTALDEVYLLAKLQKQLNAAFHVVLCHTEDVATLTGGRAALSMRQRLRVVGYPDHADLIVLAHWLTAPQPPRGIETAADILDPSAAPDAADYIASEFDDRAMAAAIVSEQDVRDGQRTIVVGVAGAGKTHLLSWLASDAPSERPAVRIRLADVPIGPGLPQAILAVWARHARSPAGQPTIDVSSSALREDRLHFLLDGLDEIANGQQTKAALLIDQVAEHFPQHAFTVTSRPVPALTALGHGAPQEATPWRFVNLVPGAAWQQRYLASRHDLTLPQLEAAMPALSDMRELLHSPFFLTRTVDLFENGQLHGLRDVGELLQRLVDFALSREQELLPMVGLGDARAWLRCVALAAAISGRRTYTVAELQEVPIADELAGDLGELVDQLQLRLLLTEEDGRLRFSHRLLADELAAEALESLLPSDELLDALVPVVDAQLAGVRDDVVIAVSLVCLRSAAWRQAIAGRDPLAAARSTPSHAPGAERAAAVELLWTTYHAWGIWAWDRSAADLVEDTGVMARLLRRDPDGMQVADLRRLLHTGSEIDQGNAVRVLARVSPRGFADDLRRVLRDPARNGVVIREAAIAAADLGISALIDDIVFAMLESPDSAVHQDGSGALRRLTPDDMLLDVAKRLAPCRDGNWFAALVKERMGATERIELARAVAVAGVHALTSDRADLVSAAGDVTPSAEVVQAAACAAALWRDGSDEIKSLLDRDPHAAALGLLEACSHGAGWWDIAPLAGHADLHVLRAAAVEDRVIQAAEHYREFQAMSPAQRDELRREAEAGWARDRELLSVEHTPPPTLAELLHEPAADTDTALNAEAFGLHTQVPTLDDEDLRELRARLAASWPAVPFRGLLTPVGDPAAESFSLAPPASAWLFLAPAAEMPVSDEQWPQLATSPLATPELTEWLRRQATVPRMHNALKLMTDMRARAWLRLLECCPAPPPPFVLEACAASAESDPYLPHDTTHLIQQLVATRITDGARAWAARDAVAARALRPMLGAAGDIEAQRLLIGELLQDVRAGRGQAPDELGWMSMLRMPEFLEALFEILEAVYPSARDAPKSGWGVHDVLTPTIEAIATIGTREAVRRYDALLAQGDALRWLRKPRDRIAADVLRADGGRASAVAAAGAAVPLFPPLDQ